MIVYGRRKHAFDSAVDPFEGISVENAQKYFIFGDPAHLFNGLSGIFDKFKGVNQAGIVKGIVFKGKIFCKTSIEFSTVPQIFEGNIKHIR